MQWRALCEAIVKKDGGLEKVKSYSGGLELFF